MLTGRAGGRAGGGQVSALTNLSFYPGEDSGVWARRAELVAPLGALLFADNAEAVLEACRRNFTPCLINDQVSIAKVLAADGAHLGQGDGSLLDARQSLGPHAVLGRTCHGSQEFMEQAVADGASYCAFGRLFDSDTKPQASGLSLHQLKDLVSQCAIPTVAIGGITLDNGRQILDTGVAMLAVSGAVFRAKEIGEAARRLSELF